MTVITPPTKLLRPSRSIGSGNVPMASIWPLDEVKTWVDNWIGTLNCEWYRRDGSLIWDLGLFPFLKSVSLKIPVIRFRSSAELSEHDSTITCQVGNWINPHLSVNMEASWTKKLVNNISTSLLTHHIVEVYSLIALCTWRWDFSSFCLFTLLPCFQEVPILWWDHRVSLSRPETLWVALCLHPQTLSLIRSIMQPWKKSWTTSSPQLHAVQIPITSKRYWKW